MLLLRAVPLTGSWGGQVAGTISDGGGLALLPLRAHHTAYAQTEPDAKPRCLRRILFLFPVLWKCFSFDWRDGKGRSRLQVLLWQNMHNAMNSFIQLVQTMEQTGLQAFVKV